MTGFEPVTSSLPRKHSTPELHRQRTSDLKQSEIKNFETHFSLLDRKKIHSKFLIPNLF